MTIVLLLTVRLAVAQDAIYLKNRWTNEYIGYKNMEAAVNASPALATVSAEKKLLWYIERIDDSYVLLKNKDGFYLNVEKGYLEAGKVPASFFSAQWKLPAAGGYNYIINRWTGVYLNNQNGKLEASTGNPAWWSAQWAMEDQNGNALTAKDFSLTAYPTLVPDPNTYYRFQNVLANSTSYYLDIDKNRSTELISSRDYGGDNGAKAWKFTQVTPGWYKISNLKLGGNKVLAIAKNTDGTYYFVLTDFANYPNQLWRMIEYKDPVLLNFYADNKTGAENLQSKYYTLVSKQHSLEAITTKANPTDNARFLTYGLALGTNNINPFDLLLRPVPVTDLALIRNIPPSVEEQIDMVKATISNSQKLVDDAMLKATPIAVSPFKAPSGHIKGEASLQPVAGGRGDLSILANSSREYTQEEWDAAAAIAGKIPILLTNNTNDDFSYKFTYTNTNGQVVEKKYVLRQGKKTIYYMDPLDTYISIVGYTEDFSLEVYKSQKYYRSKAIKIYLDGTKLNVKESIWNW
ncbi:MAG: RICIN domain-containing protein [Chitinophagaceae bacterium]|nr:RICIN domain-containing protein [Chitinophagaceae bacterium]